MWKNYALGLKKILLDVKYQEFVLRKILRDRECHNHHLYKFSKWVCETQKGWTYTLKSDYRFFKEWEPIALSTLSLGHKSLPLKSDDWMVLLLRQGDQVHPLKNEVITLRR